jgi:Pentapeptide repeats (8 copies)
VEQEPRTSRERAGRLVRLLIPNWVLNWRLTTKQLVWILRIGIVFGILFAVGYPYKITVWDWLDLLIVPAAVAFGALWFDQRQRARENQAEQESRRREQEMEDLQRERELEVETQRAQNAALLSYLDRMDDMLLRLRDTTRRLQTEDPTIHSLVLADTLTLIRTRTLTVLEPLAGRRKGTIMRVLSESGLLDKEQSTTINLRDADFSVADLKIMNLIDHDLREVSFTNANLGDANLSGTDLRGADLAGADLSGTNLRGADLRGADLSHSNVTVAQLEICRSLEGATMPDGSIHP